MTKNTNRIPRLGKVKEMLKNFFGSPVVKDSASNTRGTGLILGWETTISHAQQTKQNTESLKTTKVVRGRVWI